MIDITKDPDDVLMEIAKTFLEALDTISDPAIRLAFTKNAITCVVQGAIDGMMGGTNEQN